MFPLMNYFQNLVQITTFTIVETSGTDIISIHVPLLKETTHLINDETLGKMKNGVMLINTSRGAIIDTKCLITALKSGKIGYLGMDVYEGEAELFFNDLSGQIIKDDVS